jgi:hypothetical protein
MADVAASALESNPKPDAAAVEHFLRTVTGLATRILSECASPGVLQISRHSPEHGGDFVPSRYMLTDVELMTREVVSANAAGHNCYLEMRTVDASRVRGRKRGDLRDTAWVFALVVDADTDRGKGWTPAADLQLPTMIVETSPGNYHYYYFLDRPLTAQQAKELGDRMRCATNADVATGNVVQPYRIAGTINWPTPEKRRRGRVPVLTELH